jgi:hypothetical protein
MEFGLACYWKGINYGCLRKIAEENTWTLKRRSLKNCTASFIISTLYKILL